MTSFVESPDFQAAGNGVGGLLWSSTASGAIGLGTHDMVSQGLSGGYGGILLHIIGNRDTASVQLKLSHYFSGGPFNSQEDNGETILEVPGTSKLLNPDQDLFYYLPAYGSTFDLGRSAPVGANVFVQSVGSGLQHHGPPRVLPLRAQGTGAVTSKPTMARYNAALGAGVTTDTLLYTPWIGPAMLISSTFTAGVQIGVASFDYQDNEVALQMYDEAASTLPLRLELPMTCYHKLRVKNTTAGAVNVDASLLMILE